jgi:hypothetical protein
MDGPDDSQAFLSFHLMQIFVSSPQLRTLLAVSVFFNLFRVGDDMWHFAIMNLSLA